MGTTDSCCTSPFTAVTRRLLDPNTSPYLEIPEIDAVDNILQIGQENITALTQNENKSSDNITTEDLKIEVNSGQMETAVQNKVIKHESPGTNYQDYEVKFNGTLLGLGLTALKDGNNCIVRECLTPMTQQNISVGSIIIDINGKNVMGLPYDETHAMITDHLAMNVENSKNYISMVPLVITFRSKWVGSPYKPIRNNVNQKGLLYIKVQRCLQLKHAATYLEIGIGDTTARTQEMKPDQNPSWEQPMIFNNFLVEYDKIATVTVWGQTAIKKEKKIGSVHFMLPVKFGEKQTDALELKSDKGRLRGVIVLQTKLLPARGK